MRGNFGRVCGIRHELTPSLSACQLTDDMSTFFVSTIGVKNQLFLNIKAVIHCNCTLRPGLRISENSVTDRQSEIE